MTKSQALHERIKHYQNALGATPAPFDCYMTMRGIDTLPVRMEKHQENAMKIAGFLEGHTGVEKVIYPGLESHPQFELAKRQMSGFGGMLAFYLKGGLAEARRFLENVQLFTLAESLGGTEVPGGASRHHDPRLSHRRKQRSAGHQRYPDPAVGGNRGRRMI